ncbi:MAG TPA: sigma-70 family RNA polymerase sigma factor [Kofleriaceae bacterium]|nr:sigma-70 family RNA polymerase sigma factor [Kofleriaceae bacterium]
MGDREVLSNLLAPALDDARRAWPAIELSGEEFVEHVAARIRPHEDARAALGQLKLADLYLACAAERRRPHAVTAFEQRFMRRVGLFIRGITGEKAFVADVTQALRIKLFVGSHGDGKLSRYSGRGALESWVRAVAIRTAYDLRRSEASQPREDEHALELVAASDDPELDLLWQQYHGEFRAAFEAGLAGLAARDRTLLRLYVIERLPAIQLGKLYRVHETTVLRWLEHARAHLVERVRAALLRTLRLTGNEFDELLAVMRSRLDVSLCRLLDSRS